MPISSLTGTQNLRFDEIQNRHLVLEPVSSDKFYKNSLFTVPIGQTFSPEMMVSSGSIVSTSGTIVIEKIIHIFESETEAANFINEIGEENIASIIKRPYLRDDATSYLKTEIHLINYPIIESEFQLKNMDVERGFKIEVFLSGTNGLIEINKEPLFNLSGRIISDSYLKFFEIIPK